MRTHPTAVCLICHRSFPRDQLFPVELMRPVISDLIQHHNPEFDGTGYVCSPDHQMLRSEHLESLIRADMGEITQLEKEVLESFREHDILTENLNEQFEGKLTFGERLSDRIAAFGGSWKFISLFALVLVGWMIINTYFIRAEAFDPFPFILLNLVLSCLAAIQAPIIMMSQNRQAAKERVKSNYEYTINLKAELEIRQLNAKMDQLTKQQWSRMLEIQQVQIDLLEQLSKRK